MSDAMSINLLFVEDELRVTCEEWRTRKRQHVSQVASRHDALRQCSSKHFDVTCPT